MKNKLPPPQKMNYEQKYKEALERAKQVHKYSSDLAEIKRMEEIFPELRESEDERIRKEILEYFQQFENEELHGVNISDWIDWLEKQGEQKPVNYDCKEDEKIRKTLIENFKWFCGDFPETSKWGKDDNLLVKDIIAWLEKQEGCEHIKKDWLEHIKQSWYKEGFIDGKYSGGTSKEWTINDATTLSELIDFLENGTAKLQHDLTRYANWLKIQFTPIEKQGEKNYIKE